MKNYKKYLIVLPLIAVGLGLAAPFAHAAKAPKSTNNASFVSQSVPTSVDAGKTFQASITMKNTGTTYWTESNGYRLGSQSPRDNTIWGTGRIVLAPVESIAPGKSKTFTYTFTAPSTTGTYAFQWRMLRENVQWFGQSSTVVNIKVNTPLPPPPTAAANTVRVVYLIPSDRSVREDYTTNIDAAIRNVQDWYKSELSGYTFKINSPAVEVVHSDKSSDWFLTNPVSDSQRMNVYFNTMSEITRLLNVDIYDPTYTWAAYIEVKEGALGGGNLAVFPHTEDWSTCIDSAQNSNRCYGGLGHELGHAFGLPHPSDTTLFGDSLMYLGYLTYPNTYFTPSDKTTLLAHPLISYASPVTPPSGGTLKEEYTHSTGKFSYYTGGSANYWKETNTTKSDVYYFREVGRDSAYIYLFDTSRNMKLRIPITGGWLDYSMDNGITWNAIYLVSKAGTPPPPPPVDVAIEKYIHSTGAFTHFSSTNGDYWKESSTIKSDVYSFVETSRDINYIQLYDQSRNIRLRLPTTGGWSYYSGDGGFTWYSLYYITLEFGLAQPEKFTHSTGDFTHSQNTPGGTWLETSTLSSTTYTFNETGRDDTYIQLLDVGRNMRFRIPIIGGWGAWSMDGISWNTLYYLTKVQ